MKSKAVVWVVEALDFIAGGWLIFMGVLLWIVFSFPEFLDSCGAKMQLGSDASNIAISIAVILYAGGAPANTESPRFQIPAC